MRHILFIYRIIIVFFTVSCIFSGCQEEELNSEELVVYLRNFTGDAVNATYNKDVNAKEVLEITGGSSIEHKFQVCTSRRLETNATVSVSVNPDIVDEYNDLHQTEYVILPADSYVLDQAEMSIKDGEMQSSVGMVKIPDLSKLDVEKKYILPLTITSVSSNDKGLRISVNRNSAYIFINFNVSYIDAEASIVEGELMNRSQWGITSTGYFQSYSPNMAFDSNLKTAYINNGGSSYSFLKSKITVDLKANEKIKGFRIYPNNTLFGLDVNGKIMSFEISKDGEKWTYLGVSKEIKLNTWWNFDNPIYTYIKLFAPMETQYVRFGWVDSYNPSKAFVSVGEIEIIK